MIVARKTYSVRLDRGGCIVAGQNHTAASKTGQDDVLVQCVWDSLCERRNQVSQGNLVSVLVSIYLKLSLVVPPADVERAAAALVQTASRFDAEVTVAKDGQVVNGRSIMGVMMLAAEQGSHIEVVASGREAAEALAAIRDLVEAGFNEEQ